MTQKKLSETFFTTVLIATVSFWLWFIFAHADKVFFKHRLQTPIAAQVRDSIITLSALSSVGTRARPLAATASTSSAQIAGFIGEQRPQFDLRELTELLD